MLEAVGRVYPGPPPVTALRSVDLSIDKGEYVAIVGPSGSGKSTLLNVLGLLDRPTSGRFELDGLDVAARTDAERTALRAGRIGFIFQAFHLLPYRTSVENVALALLYAGTRRRHRDRLAAEALDRVGLANRRHSCPTEMSGGERQRSRSPGRWSPGERLTQLRDVREDHPSRGRWRCLPGQFNEAVDREGAVTLQGEQGENQPPLGRTQVHRLPVDHRFDRPEDPELDRWVPVRR
jgi:hypothetical protein